jgi:hypothetical protein
MIAFIAVEIGPRGPNENDVVYGEAERRMKGPDRTTAIGWFSPSAGRPEFSNFRTCGGRLCCPEQAKTKRIRPSRIDAVRGV